MRRAAKVDTNKSIVVDAFKAAGCSVYDLRLPVDLMIGGVGAAGRWMRLVEVKRIEGKRNPKPAKYTDLQKDFMATWKGTEVVTITDADGALALVRSMGLSPALANSANTK